MKGTMILAIALLGIAAVAQGQAVNDNLEYANQAAFDAVWPVDVGAAVVLNTEQALSGSKSVKGLDTVTRSSRTFAETAVPTDGAPLWFSFQFYDVNETLGNFRQFTALIDGAGTATNQLIAMGLYNNLLPHPKYMARVLGADGGAGAGNFFKLDGVGSPDRSVGWHLLEASVGGSKIDFYVDGILSKTVTIPANTRQYDRIRIGSGLTSLSGAAYFDDVWLHTSRAPVVVTPPTIADANSVKTHNATDFSIDLWESGVNTGNTENRQGGPTSVVVKFNKNIQRVTNTLADVLMVNGTVGAIAVAGDTLTVTASGAVNGVVSLMTFPGIATAGSPAMINTQSLCIRPLVGDADNGGAVNIFDLIQIRNNLNQPVAAANFRSDVTAEGNINIFDLIATRNALNVTVPACP